MKRYLYALEEERFYELLTELKTGAEVVKREGGKVYFYLYEPVKGLKPVKVEEAPPYEERPEFGPVSAGPFVIVPPWKKVIKVKPGMAFGTGLHPTTRLCLELLSRRLKKGDRVLDLGTGSGVLAVAAKLLGAGEVLALDVSPEAVRECKENARINRVKITCLEGSLERAEGVFDLVLANLELPIFENLLSRLLEKGSRFILSGVYGKKELNRLYELLGREADELAEEDGWYAVYLER
ncbi:MAG: methyltransferase [Aquificae bacterium]|nr:methyltransferase [Aquificota bacterium]